MQRTHVGLNTLWGTATITYQSAPRVSFWLTDVVERLSSVGHSVLERVPFPPRTPWREGWGNLGNVWCVFVCNRSATWLEGRLLHDKRTETDLEGAWKAACDISEEQKAWVVYLLEQGALNSPPFMYRQIRQNNALPLDTEVRALNVIINSERIVTPSGRIFIACVDCLGTGEREDGVACTTCTLVRITRKRNGEDAWWHENITPREAEHVYDFQLRRYATGEVMREAFASGWVVDAPGNLIVAASSDSVVAPPRDPVKA